MTKRAVLYARVSSDDTRHEGRNLEGQLTMCREYALLRGWTVVAELAEDDKGASGAALNLPMLNQIIAMARESLVDVVVVREIDRFSRRLAKQLIVEEELRRCGVVVEYVLGEYPDTPEGNLNKNIKAVIAEYERTKISERTMRSKRMIVENGGTMTHGRPPYGYRSVVDSGKEQLQIDEEEGHVVRLIYTWYTEGDETMQPLSVRGIARKLTGMQIATYADKSTQDLYKKQGRGFWAVESVGQILKNETYAGVWRYGKRRSNKGPHRSNPESYTLTVAVPAIITPEQWSATQARLKYNREDRRRTPKHLCLMARLLFCGDCKRKIGSHVLTKQTPNGPLVYRYYYCGAQGRGMSDCSQRQCFRADVVDELIWQWVRTFLLEPDTLVEAIEDCLAERKQAELPKRERLAVVTDLIEDNRRQLEKLLDLYLTRDFPRDLVRERQSRLELTLAELEREQTDLQAMLDSTTLTRQDLQSIQTFAAHVAEGLHEGEPNFAFRRRVIEKLNTTAELLIENGQQVVKVDCLLGPKKLALSSKGSAARMNHIQQ